MATREQQLLDIQAGLQGVGRGITGLQQRVETEGITDRQYQAGDIRNNPETGQREILRPDNTWGAVDVGEEQWQIERGARPIGERLPGETAPGDVSGAPGGTILDETITALQGFLDELAKKGQIINPDVEITEDQLAEFLAQAEREIDPYYATQLSAARDSLLSNLGYTKDEILKKETQWERQYGTAVRQLGEQAAEMGFAQSGLRRRSEQELAVETREDIEGLRTAGQRFGEEAGRGFAQLWGGAPGYQTPDFTIPERPTVSAGVGTFGRTGAELPLYKLSPSIYDELIGQQEQQRRGATRTRAGELEAAARTQQEIGLRRLQL